MKARIRKTGEIVEVITYSGSTIRNECIDKVSYIDSKGVEHDRETLNFYWDFEQLTEHRLESSKSSSLYRCYASSTRQVYLRHV